MYFNKHEKIEWKIVIWKNIVRLIFKRSVGMNFSQEFRLSLSIPISLPSFRSNFVSLFLKKTKYPNFRLELCFVYAQFSSVFNGGGGDVMVLTLTGVAGVFATQRSKFIICWSRCNLRPLHEMCYNFIPPIQLWIAWKKK